ncbi:LysR family transcriptional regulator [Sphingomonas prati]|uniref:DNA-binding transcriptional LysR family regulator n=1 Tax=Sphingomonas prati TaxID=1843237 RepID=A0A7W9BRY5_9SPHN|nr:LysR family transcriptional regulator [Sphingomonas prati]MBB5728498.1 DNA-binding transcriptional LysR family regulator [Sphingomonas prati]GGE73296.1 LysR family transcriptional regulator [Sphingomonas prati]
MIDRYLLRYFLAVIDQGNFTRAAQHVRVSQPTLSVGIAKLEALLGSPLFHRTNRRVEVTAAGTRFAVHARRIEAEFAAAERSVRETEAGRHIRLGIVPTLPSHWIERALRAVHDAGCTDRLEILEGRARDLRPRLDRGALDAVLCDVGDGPSALFDEGYAVAMAADHPLADRTMIDAQDIAAEPMIVRRHCEALADVSRFFTRRGVRPFMAARTTSDDRAVAYVRAGLGMTVMPRCFADDGIAMVALAGFDVRRRIGFVVAPASAARLADSMGYDLFQRAIRAAA